MRPPHDDETERTWFKNLNEHSSDDEVINDLLNALKGRLIKLTTFHKCNLYDDARIKNIVDELKEQELIKDIETWGTVYSFLISPKGSKIVSSGGWLKYLENKNKPQKPIELIQTYNNNFNGPTSITDSNFQSPSAKIEKIHGYDETIDVINTLLENIRHNQDMEHVFKSQLVDIYTELLSIAQKSKESKLPIIEQIFSVAANIKNLFPVIQS